MADNKDLSAVRIQYEELPYPPREPSDEKQRLLHTDGGSLLAINHHCFAGKKDFRQNFRCLVAGGGTGDCLIYLAEQLRDFDAEVVYLDFSASSRRIAEARAKVRGLENISWVTGSILDIPSMNLGEFDYINCSGVLHHLASPEDGLAALAETLKPGGAMYIMLYGKYGRRAVYEMQKLLREYLPADLNSMEKVRLTRQLIDALPASNEFRRDLHLWSAEIADDAGLFDLLLHTQDRAYTVPQIYAFAAAANLTLLKFTGAAINSYDAARSVTSPEIRDHIATLALPQRQAVSELLNGDIKKHEFFVGTPTAAVASLNDPDNAIVANGQLFRNAPQMAAEMAEGSVLKYDEDGKQIEIRCSAVTRIVFAHMNGKTSLRRLYKKVAAEVPKLGIQGARSEVARLFNELNRHNFAYLARKGSLGTRQPDFGRLIEARNGPTQPLRTG